MPLRKPLLVDVMIHGGDIAANIIATKLLTDRGYKVALFSKDYGYFNYSGVFTGCHGVDAAKGAGVEVNGSDSLDKFVIEVARTINANRVSFFGGDYRLKDIAKSQLHETETSLRNSKKTSSLDSALYRTLGSSDWQLLKHFPRFVKNKRVKSKCLVLTTPVRFLNGIVVEEHGDVNIFHMDRENVVMLTAARRQVTDFKESELALNGLGDYLNDFKHLSGRVESIVR